MADEFIKSARGPLLDAVKYDKMGDHARATTYYTVGIEKLMEALKYMPDDDQKKKLTGEVLKYMSRAETLKCNKPLEILSMSTRKIQEDSIGHGYDAIFSKVLLTGTITTVNIQDAYVAIHHQVQNLVRFCELLVQKAPKLNVILLTTSEDSRQNAEAFKELAGSLMTKRQIVFSVEYKKTLHDREIRFDNGWIVKIGRGLDYFKPISKYSIGALDMNLRPCKETTIDFFQTKSNKS